MTDKGILAYMCCLAGIGLGVYVPLHSYVEKYVRIRYVPRVYLSSVATQQRLLGSQGVVSNGPRVFTHAIAFASTFQIENVSLAHWESIWFLPLLQYHPTTKTALTPVLAVAVIHEQESQVGSLVSGRLKQNCPCAYALVRLTFIASFSLAGMA
ncbi:hypothetical protein CONLIGDRAFT_268993 [Coniochaeta ligniaria NRRL 30616]|uniref:Uncharacterized protein n=1 Tax=Coniochaeta ligniaria NRRL 30616 TaxID=1408157 RepID=A0A1J7IXG8_9PEZI|nr:hypothetical protein CONLIGDRAFT_268993 [Coniochaeta ligniaria NRRL 30616]